MTTYVRLGGKDADWNQQQIEASYRAKVLTRIQAKLNLAIFRESQNWSEEDFRTILESLGLDADPRQFLLSGLPDTFNRSSFM